MIFVLDTSAFSAVMRRESGLINHLRTLPPGNVKTVPSVVAEIQYGLERIENSSRRFQLLNAEKEKWLSVIDVLDWTPEASTNFGRIKADLERRRMIIDDFDIAIAAIALAHDCGVITDNIKHFERVENLTTRTWER
jgi:tRNA(fMet)-specific endonuclease VapC